MSTSSWNCTRSRRRLANDGYLLLKIRDVLREGVRRFLLGGLAVADLGLDARPEETRERDEALRVRDVGLPAFLLGGIHPMVFETSSMNSVTSISRPPRSIGPSISRPS